MLKNMRFVILFYMFHNSSFKKVTSFVNVVRLIASTRESIYQERFQIVRNRVLYEKQLFILNEIKTSLMLNFSLWN